MAIQIWSKNRKKLAEIICETQKIRIFERFLKIN